MSTLTIDPSTRTSRPLPLQGRVAGRAVRSSHLFWMVTGFWCVFLGLQWGDAFDETEHAHAAWLMGHLHQSAPADFFQHHQPLLWHLLALYYRLGLDGPEVLYWGRALVIGCGLMLCLGFRGLTRKRAYPGDKDEASESGADTIALMPMIAATIIAPTLFTIRPETFGAAFFVLAVFLWVSRRDDEGTVRLGWDFFAGVLFGAALHASPRFMFLSGAFLILPRGRSEPAGKQTRPRFMPGWGHLSAAAGCILFIIAYGSFTGYSIRNALFNIEFTRTLTRLGSGYFRLVPWLVGTGLVWALACAWIVRQLRGRARIYFRIQALYLVIVVAISGFTAWPYLHPQGFTPVLAWFSVMLALAAPEIDWRRGRLRQRVLRGLGWSTAVACCLVLLIVTWCDATILTLVQIKHNLLDMLRPEDTVMMASGSHPICIRDASYYCLPITDGEQRLSRAVARTPARWKLPKCDYLRDILENRPAIVDGYFLLDVLDEADREALRQLLAREYQPIPWTICEPGLLFQTLYYRVRRAGDL